MKVLAVFSRMLYPPTDGYKLREYHLLRHLKHHCEITPLVFEEPGISPADREHFLGEFPSLITRPNELLLRQHPPKLSQRQAESGTNIMVAEEPAQFASSIIRLLRDDRLRETLGLAARQWAASRYSWSSRAQALDAILAEAAGAADSATRPLAQEVL